MSATDNTPDELPLAAPAPDPQAPDPRAAGDPATQGRAVEAALPALDPVGVSYGTLGDALDLDQAAQYAGRSPATLRRVMRQGKLPRHYRAQLYEHDISITTVMGDALTEPHPC